MAYMQSDAAIGIKKQTVYDTAVTVDRHIEFTSESLQKNQQYLQSTAFRVGRVGPRLDHRLPARIDPSGDITGEVNVKDAPIFLEAAFGKLATGGTGPAYYRLFTCAAGDTPPSYTIQKSIPRSDGSAIDAHTFSGMICNQLQINAANDAILEFTTSWMGRDMVTNTAYVSPAYSAGATLFHFYRGSLLLGGTLTLPSTTALGSSTAQNGCNVRDCQITLNNNLDTNGWNFGSDGKRCRPNVYGAREITGQMTVEYNATTLRDASLAGTPMALLLEFAGDTNEKLQIALPAIALESNIPDANGGDVIVQQFNFSAYENGTDQLAYALVQSTVAL